MAIGPDGTRYGVANPTAANPHGIIFSLAPTGPDHPFGIVTALHTGVQCDTPEPGLVLGPAGSLVSTTTTTIDDAIDQGFHHYNLGFQVILTGPVTVTADGTVYGACAGSFDAVCGQGSLYRFTVTKRPN